MTNEEEKAKAEERPDNAPQAEPLAEEETANNGMVEEEEAEEEILNEEADDEVPAAPHLQSLGITHSGSSTTNIPPRLPEGYSYNAPRNTTAPQKPKKKKQKTAEEVHPDLSQPTDALRSEPSTFRHKKYRKKKKAHTHTGRYITLAVIILLLAAIAVSYPWWSPMLQTSDPEPTQPVVAADTLPVPVHTAPVDTMPPTLTHEDSLRIQDSIRHAQWLYWQRRRRRAQEQTEQENAQESATEATTTSSTTKTPHNDSIR